MSWILYIFVTSFTFFIVVLYIEIKNYIYVKGERMLVLYMSFIDEEKDKEKFEKIYHEYKKQMALVAMTIVHNETDTEDIVHEVFLNVATRHMNTINRIADEKDLRNYLLKATKNTALNWKKMKQRWVYPVENLEEENTQQDLSDDNFIDYLCLKIEYDHVVEAVQSLEPRYRDVLYHHLVLEVPVPELAKYLNQSVSTTKKQLVRGKKKLLLLLEGGKENGND